MQLKIGKKKILIIATAIFSFFVCCCLGILIFYNYSLTAVSKEEEKVTFVVESGSSSADIVDSLYDNRLIRNKFVGYVYLKLHGNYVLQAGVYDLDRSMSLPEILDYMFNGKVVNDSVSITFVEGKRLVSYVKQIAENFPYTEEEILAKLSDKEYLSSLIEKYWFLTDEILNDKLYYALEGYLYPNTYQFAKDASIEEIIDKLLGATGSVLNEYRDLIRGSNYSVHEVLAMASIIELEAVNSDDRATVSQVIHKRLELGMTLGMDVTTYYAVKKDMSEALLYSDLEVNNPFNTRVVAGLPVGPICNSSVESIDAVFKPSQTNYIYFYADIKTGKVYFAETHEEFLNLVEQYGS